MDPRLETLLHLTRRRLFERGFHALGTGALATLMAKSAAAAPKRPPSSSGLPDIPHHPATAKRVIYLFMHGGPSQLDLFDHKPELRKRHGEELPPSVRGKQRLTGMTSGQASKPVTSSLFSFSRCGQARSCTKLH